MLAALTVVTRPREVFMIMHRRSQSEASRSFVILLVTIASALSFFAPRARAQSGRDLAIRNAEARNADVEREMEMRRFENLKTAKPDPTASRLAFEQISEDFRQLQLVNNEMMRVTFAKGASPTLDYDHISKATAEINRRALRLRANLQLPVQAPDDAGESKREIASAPELKASLLALDKLIMGFINNPTFHKQGVLDAQHSARASRDLLVIIKLSQKIKQRAEKIRD